MITLNTTGWKQERGSAPLSEIHETIAVPKGSPIRKLLAFMGPGYLVAVGYMDPGNWATSLSGGAQFGYALLVVALMSNVMAILLQTLCVRLAIATGRDLAQSCRDAFSKPISFMLWLAAEIAICATDLAEIIGTAVGLHLLFGIPIEIGVLITALDVFLILALQRLGFRYIEAFVLALLGVIAACFAFQIVLAAPVWGDVIKGFIPQTQIITNGDMLYLALGILGATVMPHNLYLHSAIVQSRKIEPSVQAQREAIKYATLDSTIALMFALFINASILILAAAAFHGTQNQNATELADIHTLLEPVLGSAWAPIAFGVALLCCGLNSTITATLAGQAVMEGFLHIRLSPAVRRLITRGLAIIPAAVVAAYYGSAGVTQLLILSQVVLSLQLSFAVVPLVMFTASRTKMGAHPTPRWMIASASLVAGIIIILNVKMLVGLAMG